MPRTDNHFQIEGIVDEIREPEILSPNFRKQDIVIGIADVRTIQFIKMQAINDTIPILDKVKQGDRVFVAFKLTGRHYEDKVFTNVELTNLEKTPK